MKNLFTRFVREDDGQDIIGIGAACGVCLDRRGHDHPDHRHRHHNHLHQRQNADGGRSWRRRRGRGGWNHQAFPVERTAPRGSLAPRRHQSHDADHVIVNSRTRLRRSGPRHR